MDKEQVEDRRLAFGQELRKARESRGVSLPGLAQATRIRLDFVEALEDGDFAKLPGEVFGRGFVRSIGRTLGGDTKRLIELFDIAWGPSAAPQSVLKVEIKNKPTRSSNDELRIKWANTVSILRRGLVFKTLVPLIAVLLLIGAGVYGVVRGGASLVAQMKRSTVASSQQVASQASEKPTNQQSVSSSGDNTASGGSSAFTDPDQDRDQGDGDESSAVVASSGNAVGSKPLVLAIPSAAVDPKLPKVASALKKGGGNVSEAPGSELGEAADRSPALAGQAGGDPQVLELVVTEPVRIRLDADQQPSVTKELTPDTYRFTFGSKADLMIYDAAALKVLFNGKSLGSLGHKGRIRRLSFQAEPLKADKKL